MLGSTHVMSVLGALHGSPKRFVDLRRSCLNERTRSKVLGHLKGLGMVETAALRVNGRYFVHYRLTAKGKIVYKKMLELKTILRNNNDF